MHPISRFALALILAVTNTSVCAQDALNRVDMPDSRSSLDQNPVSVGDLPAVGSQVGKIRINNTLSTSTDTKTDTNMVRNQAGVREVVQQQAVVGAQNKPSSPPSEFQRFVFESTGKMLPIFGSEFFANAPSTFAPVLNAPVPSDYLLGPGDEVLVRGWGTIDIDYRAVIDRNGLVTLPTIGTVVLSGVKAGEAEGVLRGAVAKLYKGVNLSVNFGQLRSITIYLVGQASRPGTYTVSSLSTLVTALFASGGPNANGSMRRVQVKRGGKVAVELDLYAFIAKGDKSADIKLQDGDTIYIPTAIGHVALTGKVNTPAIYELRSASDTIASMLEFAGGTPVVADPRRAFLERIEPGKSKPRSVEEFMLAGDGLKRNFKNGDVLNVISITPEFANAVVLRGNVDQPIRAPFKSGMKVSDLIPSREYLISRSVIQRQNNAFNTTAGDGELPIIARIGTLGEEINWDYAVVERLNRDGLNVSLIPFNLGKVFENRSGQDNIELQPGDTVTIFSQRDVLVPRDKRSIYVVVEGEVNIPGVYQMAPSDDLHTLIARAGGPTRNAYLFGTAFYREQVRKEQEANLSKVASRLESQLRSEQSRQVANMQFSAMGDTQRAEARRQADLQIGMDAVARFRQMRPNGRISFGIAPEERSFNRLPQLKLENGDKLVVPPRPDFVHVHGAVNSETSALWHSGMNVGKYLERAGLTSVADVDNAFVIRADGSIADGNSANWFSRGVLSIEVMPGDNIVVPEKLDKESAWTRFTVSLRDWSQILANLGLGAAAIKTLK
jgi:protein involved in polysaccharide export with SLBB domain